MAHTHFTLDSLLDSAQPLRNVRPNSSPFVALQLALESVIGPDVGKEEERVHAALALGLLGSL